MLGVRLRQAKSLFCAGAALLSATAGDAATSQKDIAVLARVLAFMEPGLTGVVPAVIFYESGDPASEADARFIRAAIANSGLKNAQLTARLVSSREVGAIAGAKVVFLAAGTSNQAAIFAASAKQGAITISTDMNCVRAGRCVVGVRSTPKVEIVVGRSAREASRVRFSQAFLMLVREE